MSMYTDLGLSVPTLYEQLAEECCELAQAASKAARYLRKENPPALSIDEIRDNLVEELSDITLITTILAIKPDDEVMKSKYHRWTNRLKEHHEHHKS